MPDLYIGLISGTSMDGTDAALLDCTNAEFKVLDFLTLPYPEALHSKLNELCLPSENEVLKLGVADREVAQHFTKAVEQVLQRNQLSNEDITAIGSHGQTVRHHPDGEKGFSLQIGDPNSLAALTEIDVIADFRKRDIALGGQGAPMVPAFHRAVFQHETLATVVLNIGGIANITYLPAEGEVLGFDTGPGNRLMDEWCLKHTGNHYDKSGQWAATGSCHTTLLSQLMTHPYIKQPYPKSTGRELFNFPWLENQIAVIDGSVSTVDVQTTLAHYTAQSITRQIAQLPKVDRVMVCGGGVHNDYLMSLLQSEMGEIPVSSTEQFGISPDAVEAAAFAWLAYAFNHKLYGNIPSVTGAAKPAILGGYFPA